MSRISSVNGKLAIEAIPKCPERLTKAPSWTAILKNGVDVFKADPRRWERSIAYYKNAFNLKLGTSFVRNIMDMNAFLGGFAAALSNDPVWVMNVAPATITSTLNSWYGVIYDKGLIGIYHEW